MKNIRNRYLKDQEGVQSHVLQRKSKFDLPFDVQETGFLIKWEFETESYDVGFGLFYKEFSLDEENEELESLIPIQRFDSYVICETGTFKCEKPGTYILTLDNSYSHLRSKTVYYRVSVEKPCEMKTEKSN